MTPEKENKKGGSRLPKGAERPPKPKKNLTARQKAMRVVYIAVTVLAALIVVVFAASKLLFVKPGVEEQRPGRPNQPAASGQPVDAGGESPGVNDSGRKEDFFTFLVIGRDTGGGGNTDVVMLAAYDVPNQQLNVMSIPRDTMVNVSWDIKKINSVYNMYGGEEKGLKALGEEISQLVGFIPDYQVVVEWEAVGKMAEAIGGVEFDVPINMNYDDPTQDLHIHIRKGMQTLDAEGVMKVLRFRDGNNNTGYVTGDIGRIETQQKLLKAIVEKLLKVRDPAKILNLAEVFTENVTTDLTVQNIFWLGKQAVLGSPSLGIDRVNFITMPWTDAGRVWSLSYKNNPSYVIPKVNELVELVNEYFNPYLDDLKKSELDIMYVNKDGTLGCTSGVLEDGKYNSWLKNGGPSAWTKPAQTTAPEESGLPEPSGSPAVTESPGPDASPSPGVTPGEGGEATPPPAVTAGPTPTPAGSPDVGAPPAEPPAPTPTPASPAPATPTPDAGDQDGPPEGIPIM